MTSSHDNTLKTVSPLPFPVSPEQLSKGIDEIITGGPKALEQVQVVKAALETISNLLAEKSNLDVEVLIGQMVVGLHGDDPNQRENAAIALASTLNELAEKKEWQGVNKLLPAIRQTLYIAGDIDRVAQQSIAALTKYTAYHIRQGKYVDARNTLMIINGPKTWTSAPSQLRKYAIPAMAELLNEPTQVRLLNEYLHDEKQRVNAGQLLIAFGEQAVDFLFKYLSLSKSKEERLQLLQLIEEIGMPAELNLLQMLELKDAPWYVTRNIIRLLGVTGNANNFESIVPFLEHDDIRVRKEVLRAAGSMGERAEKQFLLKALHTVPRKLTREVVALLGNIRDDSLVVPLVTVLEQTSRVQNDVNMELQIATCEALGKIGSIKALPALTRVITSFTIPGPNRDNIKDDPLLQAAVEAVRLIRRGGRKRLLQAKTTKVMGYQVPTDPVASREAAIFRIAETGDTELATRKLFELIIECVLSKDFTNAERLRDRFKEINPMALTEIIQSTEIIEQAKLEVKGPGYFEVWSDLLHELTTEEFSAIYHELEACSLQPEELLISQGDKNDELFFINYGNVKVFYKKNYHEIYIKTLTGGDLAGENFFDASIWTISLSALTPTRISILKRSSFARWQEAYPGLEGKLKTFYTRSNNVNDLINEKGLNRRIFDRYQISRKAEIQMIDGIGNPMGRGFSGKLFNISMGGLAFLFRIAQKEHGRVLLGRKMRISIPVSRSSPVLNVQGQVLAIHPFTPQSNAHLVHFIFNEELSQETLQSVLG
jgi:HEAT repeat protein/CRP-like cAMP-binding protein